MTHPGRETGYPALPLDTTPRDGRLRQRVERVTFERRATRCEHHQHRFVPHAPTLMLRGVTLVTIPLHGGLFERDAGAYQGRSQLERLAFALRAFGQSAKPGVVAHAFEQRIGHQKGVVDEPPVESVMQPS